jgi:CheY-like chemotaxis protein
MAQILVVDDVTFIARTVAELFANSGHEARIAGSGEEAVELAQSLQPDLVLMDITLPGMDGLEATRILQTDSRTHQIPILVMSCDSDMTTVSKAFAAGASEYVVKPFETAQLLEKAEHLLGGFRMDYSIEVERQVPVVTVLNDELVLETLDELPQALRTAQGDTCRPIVLDLSRVRVMNHLVSAAIEHFERRIRELGEFLQIVRPAAGVRASAIFPGITEALRIHSDRQDAVRAAREESPEIVEAGSGGPGKEDGAEAVGAAAVGETMAPVAGTHGVGGGPTTAAVPASSGGPVAPEGGTPAGAGRRTDTDPETEPSSPPPPTPRVRIESMESLSLVRIDQPEIRQGTLDGLDDRIPAAAEVVLLDLSRVENMSPAEARELNSLVESVTLSGRNLKIVNPKPTVSGVLRLNGLGTLLFRMNDKRGG